jgi:hypothetical protein
MIGAPSVVRLDSRTTGELAEILGMMKILNTPFMLAAFCVVSERACTFQVPIRPAVLPAVATHLISTANEGNVERL